MSSMGVTLLTPQVKGFLGGELEFRSLHGHDELVDWLFLGLAPANSVRILEGVTQAVERDFFLFLYSTLVPNGVSHDDLRPTLCGLSHGLDHNGLANDRRTHVMKRCHVSHGVPPSVGKNCKTGARKAELAKIGLNVRTITS
jgi:hypothetical protein